ncbi:MAG: COG4223 family protein [Mesorhizobium sp.]|nr:COG4223 family protein [Mesorhizobium sp.]
MVKTPKTRHSKSRREPVTIELEPGAVSRIVDEDATKAKAGETKASDSPPVAEPVHAEQSDLEPWEHADAPTSGKDEQAKPGGEDFSGPDSTYPGATAEAATAPEDGKAGTTRSFDYDFSEKTQAGAAAAGGESAGNGQAAFAPPPARGGARGLGAGVIGGIVALAVAGGLQFAGLLGAPGQNASGVSIDDVNSQVAALKSEIARLKETNGGDVSSKVDGFSSALDHVKSDVAALKSAVQSGGTGDSAAIASLTDKLSQVESAVATLNQAPKAAPVDLGPVNEKLAGLDALVKSAGDAAKSEDGRIGALEQSVSQLSGKVEAQASQPKIALAIAASALKAALDRGAPFSAELETFAAIAPNAPELATLRGYADKGVPTRAEIATQVDAAANAMVAAAKPADANAGFFQNLVSSAQSLVKVRPVGAVEGKGAPETVARMEVAVNQGDYAKALSEYETLPDAAKAAGADFAGKLKARIEVEAQIGALIADAMKA